ncbi:uncharacterized protein LOC129566067 [Sitodiplosis mosellana]|uniref:uncharacterized protein LOC129566067 n=1 Tax=Sitodiplosis mosellana TaxID=263140 RepID=UPI002443C2B5|nr:uncharacterized protein LOC129566067 [Sitodiplosis mosellana]
MDAESELNLYNHVNFLATTSKPNKKSANRKNRSVQNERTLKSFPKPQSQQNARAKKNINKFQSKPYQGSNASTKQKSLNNVRRIQFKLSANELLFFPKRYNPRPERSATTVPNDLMRKSNYLAKVSVMSTEKQRKLRSEQDARYLNKPATIPDVTEDEEKALCYDHLVGRCNSQSYCGRYHQLRNPRIFGVCKYYLSGCCTNGDLCQFMHEDYPCRFYYLDIDHPKGIDEENCRFKHGGPLPKRLYYNFKKQIGMWAKEITKEKPENFDSVLMDYIEKFETKHEKLEEEYGVQNDEPSTVTSEDDRFSIESILSSKQLKALAEKNITTAAQINQGPIDDLIDLGLTMDQIYTITTNTCNESDQSQVTGEDFIDHNVNDDVMGLDIVLGGSNNSIGSSTNVLDCVSNALDSSTDVDSQEIQSIGDLDVDSLLGFAQIEMKEAEQFLQTKQSIFLGGQRPTNECLTLEKKNSTDQLVTVFKTKSEACKTEMINQKQNFNSDNSDDSDSEFSLIINEDV